MLLRNRLMGYLKWVQQDRYAESCARAKKKLTWNQPIHFLKGGFFTLTQDEEHFTTDENLMRQRLRNTLNQVQKWSKRTNGKKVHYFWSMEKGSLLQRLHVHLLFSEKIPIEIMYRYWPFGYIKVLGYSEAKNPIGYLTSYVSKKAETYAHQVKGRRFGFSQKLEKGPPRYDWVFERTTDCNQEQKEYEIRDEFRRLRIQFQSNPLTIKPRIFKKLKILEEIIQTQMTLQAKLKPHLIHFNELKEIEKPNRQEQIQLGKERVEIQYFKIVLLDGIHWKLIQNWLLNNHPLVPSLFKKYTAWCIKKNEIDQPDRYLAFLLGGSSQSYLTEQAYWQSFSIRFHEKRILKSIRKMSEAKGLDWQKSTRLMLSKIKEIKQVLEIIL